MNEIDFRSAGTASLVDSISGVFNSPWAVALGILLLIIAALAFTGKLQPFIDRFLKRQ